jgi:hypothetical protein
MIIMLILLTIPALSNKVRARKKTIRSVTLMPNTREVAQKAQKQKSKKKREKKKQKTKITVCKKINTVQMIEIAGFV